MNPYTAPVAMFGVAYRLGPVVQVIAFDTSVYITHLLSGLLTEPSIVGR